MAGVPEEVARLDVNLDNVSSFLFTHHMSKEPMVFYVPNKAVRNSLKLHVNEGGGYLVGSMKSREAKNALENGYPVYTILDTLTPLSQKPSGSPHALTVDYLLDCLKTNLQQPLKKYQVAAAADSAALLQQSPNTAKRNLLADFAKDCEQGKSSLEQPLDSVDRELIDVLSVMRDTSAEEEEEEAVVGKKRKVGKQKKKVHIVLPSPQRRVGGQKAGQQNCVPSRGRQNEDQDGPQPMGEASTASSVMEDAAGMCSPCVDGQEEGAFNIEGLQWAVQERTAQAIIASGTPVLSAEEKLSILADVTGQARTECSRALSCMSQDVWEALKYLRKVNTAPPWTKQEDDILVGHLQTIHSQLGHQRSFDSVISRMQFLASRPP